MKSATATVVVGTVGAPFGVQGWMHVRSFTAPLDNILAYRPWQFNHGGQWQTVDAEARVHHGGFIARVANVTDRNSAALLTGAQIGVDRAVLPAPDTDEYYWRDLIGLSVRNLDGDNLGSVSRLLPTPGHDVLVVADDDRERLIPFVRNAIAQVDTVAGCIVVDWQLDWH